MDKITSERMERYTIHPGDMEKVKFEELTDAQKARVKEIAEELGIKINDR
ncbi:MAG: hypothetical protein QMB61_09075 [Clostridiaceae bacterium]